MGEKKEKMNIAMLGHKRIPSREGGVEVVVEELSTRMVSQGHSVTCYNRGGHHVGGSEFDREKQDTYRGVRMKTVWTVDKKGLAAMTSSFFGAICAAFGKYDVVHFHAEGPCAMLWLPKLFGKRCIATIHGLDHKRAKWGKFASWYIMRGEKCAARYADEIIVLSESVQQYFWETYQRKTVFIPNGVDRHEPARPDMILGMGLEPRDYILYLGRVVPEKGLHYLIEAFQGVKTDKKLLIAGGSSDTGEYLESLKEQAKPDHRIEFAGFVQGQLLEELYSNAYFYVLPSDLEGMPLSLLEAMSFGNCCLVSDIPECVAVVDDHGVAFRHSDVADLQNKLQQLCDDAAMVRSYEINAAEYICQKYNWDEVAQQTLQLYQV